MSILRLLLMIRNSNDPFEYKWCPINSIFYYICKRSLFYWLCYIDISGECLNFLIVKILCIVLLFFQSIIFLRFPHLKHVNLLVRLLYIGFYGAHWLLYWYKLSHVETLVGLNFRDRLGPKWTFAGRNFREWCLSEILWV